MPNYISFKNSFTPPPPDQKGSDHMLVAVWHSGVNYYPGNTDTGRLRVYNGGGSCIPYAPYYQSYNYTVSFYYADGKFWGEVTGVCCQNTNVLVELYFDTASSQNKIRCTNY